MGGWDRPVDQDSGSCSEAAERRSLRGNRKRMAHADAPFFRILAGAAAALTMALLPSQALAQPCPAGRFTLLTNGKIHTMDAKRTVVSKVRIANGRFVEVGDAASAAGGCTDTIDLRGRTVIPGMIDNHFPRAAGGQPSRLRDTHHRNGVLHC